MIYGPAYQRRAQLLALLLYSLLAAIMTWPLIATLGTVIPAGSGGDVWSHWWTFQWVKTAITEGRNPFYTDLLYYPGGVSLTTHNIPWLNIALWLPLQVVVGDAAAYSLLYIAFFTLNGFAMYLLVYDWTESRPASLIGGLIYGFWPYALSQYGHPNMIPTCWLLLALLYLRRALANGQVRDALLTGLFVALIGITRWQLLIIAAVIIGLYVLYLLLEGPVSRDRRNFGLLLLVGAVAAALMAPLAIPVVAAQLSGESMGTTSAGNAKQTDLLAYVLPNENLNLWAGLVEHLPVNLRFGTARIEFIGFASIALALYGAVKSWRSARIWVLVAVVLILLALGPQLRAGGLYYHWIPMPYRLLEDFLLARVLRHPQRFNIFLGLPVGILAALGTSSLLERPSFRSKSTLIALLLSVAIISEYWLVPYRTAVLSVPGWYRQIAHDPERFALLDLPMDSEGADKRYMMYQTSHGKPLVGGHVSRRPTGAYAFIEDVPLLDSLWRAKEIDFLPADVAHQLRPLADADVRYLVLHKRFTAPEQLLFWQNWLAFEPTYEDEEIIVYRTDPRLGRDFELTQNLTSKIGLLSAVSEPMQTTQAGRISVKAVWGASGRPGQDYDTCLELLDQRGKVMQLQCQILSPDWPTSQWEKNEVVNEGYELRPDPHLSAGSYTLALSLAEHGHESDTGRALVLGTVEIESLPRVFVEPQPEETVGASWGDVIQMPGYTIRQSEASLELAVYWRAMRRMDKSYKVFVHVVDQATGNVVQQHDAVPRGWTYPTNWWENGEVIEDTITLHLEGLESGQYDLSIGLYDPETGERLDAFSPQGEPYPGNAVPLASLER